MKPARASVSISIDTPMNAEAPTGFDPKGPYALSEAGSYMSLGMALAYSSRA